MSRKEAYHHFQNCLFNYFFNIENKVFSLFLNTKLNIDAVNVERV